MSHVFLSYMRDDQDQADRLRRDLVARGVEIWQDKTHLKVGDPWKLRVRQAIEDGAFFLACFSNAYVRQGGDPRYVNEELAVAIERRVAKLQEWRKIYYDDFIPFAHGVRQLGQFYNDTVQPEDPYEFVGLLRGESMIASRRNRLLGEMAGELRRYPE